MQLHNGSEKGILEDPEVQASILSIVLLVLGFIRALVLIGAGWAIAELAGITAPADVAVLILGQPIDLSALVRGGVVAVKVGTFLLGCLGLLSAAVSEQKRHFLPTVTIPRLRLRLPWPLPRHTSEDGSGASTAMVSPSIVSLPAPTTAGSLEGLQHNHGPTLPAAHDD